MKQPESSREPETPKPVGCSAWLGSKFEVNIKNEETGLEVTARGTLSLGSDCLARLVHDLHVAAGVEPPVLRGEVEQPRTPPHHCQSPRGTQHLRTRNRKSS